MSRTFDSLWLALPFVVDTLDEKERLALMPQVAREAIEGTHPVLRPVYHKKFNQIVGWRLLDPKSWFAISELEIRGPFPTKRLALRSVHQKTANKVAPGHYEAGGWTFVTRQVAEATGLDLGGN